MEKRLLEEKALQTFPFPYFCGMFFYHVPFDECVFFSQLVSFQTDVFWVKFFRPKDEYFDYDSVVNSCPNLLEREEHWEFNTCDVYFQQRKAAPMDTRKLSVFGKFYELSCYFTPSNESDYCRVWRLFGMVSLGVASLVDGSLPMYDSWSTFEVDFPRTVLRGGCSFLNGLAWARGFSS